MPIAATMGVTFTQEQLDKVQQRGHKVEQAEKKLGAVVCKGSLKKRFHE
jgi:hypothetical protein